MQSYYFHHNFSIFLFICYQHWIEPFFDASLSLIAGKLNVFNIFVLIIFPLVTSLLQAVRNINIFSKMELTIVWTSKLNTIKTICSMQWIVYQLCSNFIYFYCYFIDSIIIASSIGICHSHYSVIKTRFDLKIV